MLAGKRDMEMGKRGGAHVVYDGSRFSWVHSNHGIPPIQRRVELLIEDLHAYLEEQVRSSWTPAHVLLLHSPLAHHLIHD
jgi:hypothetical protein